MVLMHLIYIDESKDTEVRPKTYIYSALCISDDAWRRAFDRIRDYRRDLRQNYGIYIKKELHACEFVSGKGMVADRPIYKQQRAQIFRETIQFMGNMGGAPQKACLFNSICDNPDWAMERLINRIQRTMVKWDSHALLLFDEGEEAAFKKKIRKMNVFNPISSRYGVWQDTGQVTRNIVIDRILEDPFFKKSDESYFIQMVDFCAYALLRKERPLASKTRFGIDQAFDDLEKLCFKDANYKDPMGVIR